LHPASAKSHQSKVRFGSKAEVLSPHRYVQ
jgi:hypothetical protein